MANKNVLVLVPGTAARGGVTTYYKALRKHLPIENVHYLERGARSFPYKKNLFLEIYRLTRDYSLFIWKLMTTKIDIVHTNTSFDKSGVIRDTIYIKLGKLFGKKIITFYRGWDDDYADKVLASGNFFCKTLLSVDTSIVLAEKFKNDLSRARHKGKIYVESTTVDTELIDLKSTLKRQSSEKSFNILYLARLEKGKGVYIVLDAFRELKSKYPFIQLFIGGDGQEYDNLQKIIRQENVKDVALMGFVSGETKAQLLVDSDVYVFPTNYKEGMPNSVLEAFAFGLPVITRPVAGLKDIFQDQRNGFLISSLDVSDYSKALVKLITESDFYKTVSGYNLKYGERFYSSNVAKRLLNIYKEIG